MLPRSRPLPHPHPCTHTHALTHLPWPGKDWPISTPEQQGLDPTRLADLLEAIQDRKINLHSLLIARHGRVILEVYYPPYTPEIRHTIQSNTKSVIGALIGIAIDQGKIKSVDQPVLEFFPGRPVKNLDDQKRDITLRHLLAMQPGLKCADRTMAGDGLFTAKDWTQYILDLPMQTAPGKAWVYCSAASHLLSAVLQQATGMDARTFANQYLFQPIGIPAVTEQDWAADPQGVSNGVAALYLTPRELARFGYLYLHQGQWAGRQVIPQAWVVESTRPLVDTGTDTYIAGVDRRFGYLFSVFPELKYFGFLGMAGQELFILPEQDMVVVFTGSLVVGKETELLALVNEYIIPAVQSDGAIPASPEASARLLRLVKSPIPSRQAPAPLPRLAGDISGKTYRLDRNSLDWQSMTFIFQPEAEEAILKMPDTPDLKIGLDQIFRFTEMPTSRPVGLRGAWTKPNEFALEFITLGDFPEATANITFEADRIKIALNNRNFSGVPIILNGTLQEQ